MRVLRAKVVRKSLRFYKIVFGIDSPYNVILDGNFIFAAIKFKIDIRDRLQKLFQGNEVKLFVLSSIISELEQVGLKAEQALQFARMYCEIINDEKIVGNTSEKLLKLIGGQGSSQKSLSNGARKYCVVSQDKELRSILASKPGVPLLYLNKVTLVLEPPSTQSHEHNMEVENHKVALNTEESRMVIKTINEVNANVGSNSDTNRTRVKRKATAPNPLSSQAPSEDSKNAKKRKLAKFRS